MNLDIISFDKDSIRIKVNGEVRTDGQKSHSSRQVFLFDTFVVKFDDCGDQNEAEIGFYENVLKPEDDHYFPRLLGHGTCKNERGFDVSFVVQERVFNSKKVADAARLQELRDLKDKYKLYDISLSQSDSDNHWNALITEDDRLIVYDIGMRSSGYDTESARNSESMESYRSCDCSQCRDSSSW